MLHKYEMVVGGTSGHKIFFSLKWIVWQPFPEVFIPLFPGDTRPLILN